MCAIDHKSPVAHSVRESAEGRFVARATVVIDKVAMLSLNPSWKTPHNRRQNLLREDWKETQRAWKNTQRLKRKLMDSKKKNEKNLECALSFVEGSEPFDDVVLTADVRHWFDSGLMKIIQMTYWASSALWAANGIFRLRPNIFKRWGVLSCFNLSSCIWIARGMKTDIKAIFFPIQECQDVWYSDIFQLPALFEKY